MLAYTFDYAGTITPSFRYAAGAPYVQRHGRKAEYAQNYAGTKNTI